MPPTAAGYALGAWAGAVAWIDFRHRRVPNVLLLLMLVPALLALGINRSGLLGVDILPSIAGMLVAGIPLLPGYALGQMGAGDVKFAGSLGLLLGPGAALEMLLIAAALLGAVSAAVWWSARGAVRNLRLPAAPVFGAAFGMQLVFGRLLPLPF